MRDWKTAPLKNSARVVSALLALWVLAISAYSVGAEPLASFDVNGAGGPTQTGFEPLNGPGSAKQNGITINVSGGSLSRDRGTGSPAPDVSRDFLASEHPDNSDAIKVTLDGLTPSTRYRLRWHHHENANNSAGNRLALYRDDNSAPENLLFESEPYGNATTNFFTDFEATTDNRGTLTFVTGKDSHGGTVKILNGLEVLRVVPEPYNGIRPPAVWPPRVQLTREPMSVPYLESPPKIVPIDVGRQLFVDDFLIEHTSLQRTFYAADYHPANPVVRPDQPWEQRVAEGEQDKHGTPQGAWVFSDGVWYDPAEKLFKMWYNAGFLYSTCLATSQDGIHWTKPSLNVVEPGTNIVMRHRRDSTTVWLDQHEKDPQRRFKSFAVESSGDNHLNMRYSPDGISWSEPVCVSPPIGDRSTVFYNPFRQAWVCSMRTGYNALGRTRAYTEHEDAAVLVQTFPNLVDWVGADRLDPPHPAIGAQPDLYTLDAVAYESLLLGAFAIMHGGMPDGAKKVDVCIGFSRDGFHWDRPNRTPLLPNSEQISDWNWGYIHSAGGVCLVVGDKLYFYACGRTPTPGGAAGLEKGARTYSTGLATLRRDGFASMNAADDEGTLTTRLVLFQGKHLFVNAAAGQGELRVEVLDEAGNVMEPFDQSNCVPLSVDKTLAEVRWKGAEDLSAAANKPVRFRFHLRQGSLYAFWVSPERSGASHGYVAAGGPGFSGPTDTIGAAAYRAADAASTR